MTVERRFLSNEQQKIQIEERAEGQTSTITGYGAVFFRSEDSGTEFQLYERAVERIMPEAFNDALTRDDVRGLFNHDANHLLGRTGSGTMRLSVDGTGLRYEIDIPDTQAGRDTLESIKRGDLTGSSFSFVPESVTWREEKRGEDTFEVREINSVKLYDVGPVTFPAYKATTAGTRSEDYEAERANFEAENVEKVENHKNIKEKRARLVELGLI